MFSGQYDTNLLHNLHSQTLTWMYIPQGILHNAEKLKRKYFSSNFILLQQLSLTICFATNVKVLEGTWFSLQAQVHISTWQCFKSPFSNIRNNIMHIHKPTSVYRQSGSGICKFVSIGPNDAVSNCVWVKIVYIK